MILWIAPGTAVIIRLRTGPNGDDGMRVALAIGVALLAGCAPQSVVENAGLDYGRQYVWAKDGAGEVERRRTLVMCSRETEEELRGALMAHSIPFMGLALVPATVATQNHVSEQRWQCMERDGWRLVDVMSGAPQRMQIDPWRGPVLNPR